MIVTHGLPEATQPHRAAVAIGTFDGVHLGHQELIRQAIAEAHLSGMRSVALTFDRHPLDIVDSSRSPVLLTSASQRSERIAELGPDVLMIARFDHWLRDMSAAAFVADILVGRLNAGVVCVGDGFTFGCGGVGNPALLARLANVHGFRLVVVPVVLAEDVPVSSSRVRALIVDGDVAQARVLLGRPFEVEGLVEAGDGIGRRLGYPTANLLTERRQAMPADGVYATVVTTSSGTYPGALSIGIRPTLGTTKRVAEVHLAGFEGDLYGSVIRVAFLQLLRCQERFSTLERLAEQVGRDVAETVRVVASSPPLDHLSG